MNALTSSTLGHVQGYIRRFGSAKWALADQVVVSGSNFLSSILLARILGIEEFGRYVLAWTIVLFVQNLQFSTIGSTMMSIGPKQNSEAAPRFYGSMFAIQMIVGFIAAVSTLLIAYFGSFFFPTLGLETIAVPLTVAIACSQTHDFLRRYFFSIGRLPVSFSLDATRFVVQNIATLTLIIWFPRTSVSALWLISAAAALGSVVGLPFIPRLKYSLYDTRKIAAYSWTFSKWLGGSTLMGFAFANLFTFAAGILLGTAAVGAMRAAFALVSVTNLVIEAFANVVPVNASRELMSKGRSGLAVYLRQVTIYGVVAMAILLTIICIGSKFWLGLFFGPAFEMYSNLIFWYAVIQLLTFLAFIIGTYYRTLEYTRFIFAAYAFSAIFSLAIAYPLIKYFGLTGAMFGLLMGQLSQLLFMSIGAMRTKVG